MRKTWVKVVINAVFVPCDEQLQSSTTLPLLDKNSVFNFSYFISFMSFVALYTVDGLD